MKKQIDFRLVLFYLILAFIAWLITWQFPSPSADAEHWGAQLVFQLNDLFFDVEVWLYFAGFVLLSSAFGWFLSKKSPARPTFGFIFLTAFLAVCTTWLLGQMG